MLGERWIDEEETNDEGWRMKDEEWGARGREDELLYKRKDGNHAAGRRWRGNPKKGRSGVGVQLIGREGVQTCQTMVRVETMVRVWTYSFPQHTITYTSHACVLPYVHMSAASPY